MEKDFNKEFKLSLELEGEKRISCNDLFSLLENILKYGSISRAASAMGISYRYSWGIVGVAEKALGLELVHRQVGGHEGGGTSLSSEGRDLLEQYKSFKQEVDSQLEHFINRTSSPRRAPAAEDPLKDDISETNCSLPALWSLWRRVCWMYWRKLFTSPREY